MTYRISANGSYLVFGGRQQKSSRAGQQNNFFIFQPDFKEEIAPKNATKHPVA